MIYNYVIFRLTILLLGLISVAQTYFIISGLHKQLLLHSRWPFSSPMDCNFMFRCWSYFPMSNRSLEEVLKLNSLFVMDLSCWHVSNFRMRTFVVSLIANPPVISQEMSRVKPIYLNTQRWDHRRDEYKITSWRVLMMVFILIWC